jgi:hypothetical protein
MKNDTMQVEDYSKRKKNCNITDEIKLIFGRLEHR